MYCGLGAEDGTLWGSALISGVAGSTGRVKVRGGAGITGLGVGVGTGTVAGVGVGETVVCLGGKDGAGAIGSPGDSPPSRSVGGRCPP